MTAAPADLVTGAAVRPTVAAIAAPATWNMSLLVVAGTPLPSDIQGRGLGRLCHLRKDDEDGAGHTAVEVCIERTSSAGRMKQTGQDEPPSGRLREEGQLCGSVEMRCRETLLCAPVSSAIKHSEPSRPRSLTPQVVLPKTYILEVGRLFVCSFLSTSSALLTSCCCRGDRQEGVDVLR